MAPPGQPNTASAKIKANVEDALSTAAFLQALGMHPSVWQQQGPTKTEVKESSSVDVGAVVKALTDHSSNLSKEVLNTMHQAKGGGEDTVLKFMMDELKNMRSELTSSRNQDPMVAIKSYVNAYGEMMDKVKKDLNLPAAAQITPANESFALQTKRIDLEIAQLQHQWQVELAQFNILREDAKDERAAAERRWQADLQMKKEELQAAAVKSENLSGFIQDIIASFAASVDRSGGGMPVAVQVQPEPPTYRAKAFICGTPGCGTRIPIIEGQPEAGCPKCGVIYDMGGTSQQPPPTQNPQAPVSPPAPVESPPVVTA